MDDLTFYILIGWLIVGTAVGMASCIYLSSLLPNRPDLVDGLFLACVWIAVAVVWPLVILALPFSWAGRIIWDARSLPPGDS